MATIIQGFTEQNFHTLPNEVDLVTVAPARAAIESYIERIAATQFPEFVRDLLVIVEGHKPEDITDGTGDEKQDILTIAPDGKRHLTQCKHAEDSSKHVKNDELDLMFSACHRKNCSRGLLVTNGDLTAPAKRYVLDREYHRLGGQVAGIDYWNATRIWERVSRSPKILNKWFGGMGQVHALRRFWFNLVIQKMPEYQRHALTADALVAGAAEGKIKLDDQVSFTIEDWFHPALGLGLEYVGSKELPVNIPLHAFRICVEIDGEAPYDPQEQVARISTEVASKLEPVPEPHWWHLVATPAQAFIFLQDICQPKIVDITSATAFVRIADQTLPEATWIAVTSPEWKRVEPSDGQRELAWVAQTTKTLVRVAVEQRLNPVAVQHMREAYLEQVTSFEPMSFIRAPTSMLDTIRTIVPLTWSMIEGSGSVYISVPDEKGAPHVLQRLHERMSVSHVTSDQKRKLIRQLRMQSGVPTAVVRMIEDELSTPISLPDRVLWFQRELVAPSAPSAAVLAELAKFKMSYEHRHGYNYLAKRTKATMSPAQIRSYLFDFMSARGGRMLDITATAEPSVNLRIRVGTSESTQATVEKLIGEFDQVCAAVKAIVG